MPAHDKSKFPFSDKETNNDNLSTSWSEDDALWMLLNTYADGEATPEEMAQVEALLRTHPELSRDFAFLQLTSESVREFAEVEPPVTLTSAIFAATTHRATWRQRVSSAWTQFGRLLLPAPMRFGLVGGALAAGILAFVLWPRHSVHPMRQPELAVNNHHLVLPVPQPKLAGKNGPEHRPLMLPSPSSDHIVLPQAPKALDPNTIAKVEIPLAKPAPQPATKPMNAELKHSLIAKYETPNRIKTDGPAGLSFVPSKSIGEERHMALNTSDSGAGGTGAQSLGPDVSDATPEDTHVETAAMSDMGAPPAHDDPPPVRVSTVSYKPGSISENVRSAPPTLAMRANEAIRREQELQKYGGYGKDAVNNIQRGEVGFSLVGGKF